MVGRHAKLEQGRHLCPAAVGRRERKSLSPFFADQELNAWNGRARTRSWMDAGGGRVPRPHSRQTLLIEMPCDVKMNLVHLDHY